MSTQHPQDQIIEFITRIYTRGMTTTSGGNLSILDDDGSLWITPAGIDKGRLTRDDVVHVYPNGQATGKHRPSSEYPFHFALYQKRPDIKSVVHAHSPSLVSFSIIRAVPQTKIMPSIFETCDKVGYADYAVPGSQKLGENISQVAEEGYDTILLENHGVVTLGTDLFDAYNKLETLEYCGRVHIAASQLGETKVLCEDQLKISQNEDFIEEVDCVGYQTKETQRRREMIDYIHRSYEQSLITATEGIFSMRVNENSFLITPLGLDRSALEPSDLVLITDGKKEKGKTPNKNVNFHMKFYASHPTANVLIIACPANVMAFAVTQAPFNTRIIPESFMVLQDVFRLTFKEGLGKSQDTLLKTLSKNCPAVLIENDCLVTTGKSLFQAFDRLEVAEFSAGAAIKARSIGKMIEIDDADIEDIRRIYLS